jgi:lipopolysaccharide cholinephosphotransferase
MKKKTITLEERKQIQLEMLDEIDAFCRNHNIRYSLAFGTLIGAIRHKGYIPWDDDVDLIMPLPDMLRFKKEFKSDKLAYVDIDTVPHFEYHFSRICYLPTYSKTGLLEKSYGVNIDLYPVVGMPDTEEGIQRFLDDIDPLYKKRLKLIARRHRLIRRLPFAYVPGYDSTIRQFHDIILNSYPYENAHNYLHAGSVRRVNILDFDVFDGFIDVEFEGHTFQSMERYHEYLTHCFGDYMQLPPENQRNPYHGGKYYWK